MLTEEEQTARERVGQHIAVARNKMVATLGTAKDPQMRTATELALKDYDLLIEKLQGLLQAQSKYIIGKAANVVQDMISNYSQ